MNKLKRQLNKENFSKEHEKKAAYQTPKLQAYGTVSQLTTGVGPSGVDASLLMPASDRRLKEDIVQIGTHWLGIGLYLFDYKSEYRDEWGNGRQFGVMADEVETVMPEAVSVHPDGYKLVNYEMLGISRALH